jgi:alpha-N-acetylglucosamine transferase
LIGHYDKTGELNKLLERAKEEISRLHYKDEKAFPFERFSHQVEGELLHPK